MEKLMSHLAISPSPLLIQHLNFMAIAPSLQKSPHDYKKKPMTRVSLVDKSKKI
jgi:hypothetical protein